MNRLKPGGMPVKPKSRKPVMRFEPITRQQNRKLHAIVHQKKLSEHQLYKMVEQLIGIPSISSLTKQEASYIIRRIEGQGEYVWTYTPQTSDYFPVHPSRLPNLSYIRGIRFIAKELGWDKTHLKNWLKKYMKTQSIRDLDPETARKAFIGLRRIRSGQQAHVRQRPKAGPDTIKKA